jgi:hypothetical protein
MYQRSIRLNGPCSYSHILLLGFGLSKEVREENKKQKIIKVE